MFVHLCTSCAKRQLIFPSQIGSVDRAGESLVYGFTCWCGVKQTATISTAARARVAA